MRTILKYEWDIVDDETAQKKMGQWYDAARGRVRAQCEDFKELCLRADGYLKAPTIEEEIAVLETFTDITAVDPTNSCVKCDAIVDTFVHKVRDGHCPSCHEAIAPAKLAQFVEPTILLDRISTRPTAKQNYENFKQPNLFEIGRND